MEELKRESYALIFNFEQGPLLNVRLVQMEDDKHILLFTIHHSICDPWSMDIMEKELIELYATFAQGAVPQLPPVSVQFKDYVNWCNGILSQGKVKAYWHEKLANLPSVNIATTCAYHQPDDSIAYRDQLRTELREALDYRLTNSEEEQFFGAISSAAHEKGATYDYMLDNEKLEIIKRLATESNTSVSVALIGVFNLAICKIIGHYDHIIGLNTMLRDHENVKNVIGFLVNTIFLRNTVEEDSSIKEYMSSVNQNLLDAYNHSLYPVEKLLDNLNMPLGRISKIFLNIINSEDNKVEDVMGEIGPNDEISYPYFEMDFLMVIHSNGVSMRCSYLSDIYDSNAIGYIHQEFSNILDYLKAHPGTKIGEIGVNKPHERELLAH